jgi:Cd(II)/Pb(II)-responsive transcriptional regulator
MKIGELAKLTHCSVETIRFYEKIGLLPLALRTESNYREYQALHLERLRFIRNCRAFDMSHDEIRQLISLVDTHAESCESVNLILDEHIHHIEDRIAELNLLVGQLRTLRQSCQQQQGIAECGIVQGLSALALPEKTEHHSHLSK